MVPALAIALFAVGGAMAFAFDRLWQEAAAVELRTAGEAAALAAAAELASDDTLRTDADWNSIRETARDAAADIAKQNLVGGLPVTIKTAEDGDVTFGQTVDKANGEQVFVETADNCRVVHLHARQGRGSKNPFGLLVRDLTGAGRQMQLTIEATAENRIASLRPYEGVNVPALPIAISVGPTAWAQAENHLGPDAMGLSEDDKSITETPDGISEMTAQSSPQQADQKQQVIATLHVVDMNNGLSQSGLAAQCRDGWSSGDFAKWDGELPLDQGATKLTSSPKIPPAIAGELAQLVGQTRLCWVYTTATPTANSDRWQLTCPRLVGIRILSVQALPDGMIALQLQPATVVTRTAVPSDDSDDDLANPYLFKVFLNR
jgi:hypothetical protein